MTRRERAGSQTGTCWSWGPLELSGTLSPTVENEQTNNKTELFQSKFCAKNRAFLEPFKKENRARTACLAPS